MSVEEDYRVKNAREGKAIYIPGKTVAQVKAEAAAESARLAQISARTVELSEADWDALDPAIPDVLDRFADVERVFAMLGYAEDLDRMEVNSLARMASRALRSMQDKEMMVLDRLNRALLVERSRMLEAERQADIKGKAGA